MKTFKVLGVASLLALGAAFAAPTDEQGAISKLVQMVQALPDALSESDLTVQQAKALQSAIDGASGTYLTAEQAQSVINQIQGVLTADQYKALMNVAASEPQVILPSSDASPLADDGVQNATKDANNFLDSVIVSDIPAANRVQ
ncbi:MAG: hypothetical protein C4332_16625 [Meiothermus sp.]